MNGITGKTSRAILRCLVDCKPRALSVPAITVYASPIAEAMLTNKITLRHLFDLERHGFVEREADPLSADELNWKATESASKAL